jgi:DNA invertase Pin-like site-specific DNA recombinase
MTIGLSVVGYARVSTQEQRDSGAGLAAQRAAIVAEADRRGWELVDLVEDGGFSGRDLRRPALASAMGILARREARALVVAKLDRLSRSMLDFASIMATADKEHWAIITLDCAIDTTTPAGEAMANVILVFAQFERRLIQQRTSDALRQLRSEGRVYGPVPYGFRRDGGALIAEPTQQRVVRRIQRLRESGHSYRRIADALNRSGVPASSGGVWWAMTVRGVERTAPHVGTRSTEAVA